MAALGMSSNVSITLKTTPFPPLPSFSFITYLPKRFPIKSSSHLKSSSNFQEVWITGEGFWASNKRLTAGLTKPLNSSALEKKLTPCLFCNSLRNRSILSRFSFLSIFLTDQSASSSNKKIKQSFPAFWASSYSRWVMLLFCPSGISPYRQAKMPT